MVISGYAVFSLLVRSGNIRVDDSYIKRAGFVGFYWPSSASKDDTIRAYYLSTGALTVLPSDSPGLRHRGFSLRCLQE